MSHGSIQTFPVSDLSGSNQKCFLGNKVSQNRNHKLLRSSNFLESDFIINL
ncbi:hypothetical protein Hanom_Chr08g00735891 [Helianthus anomalus]